MTDLKGHLSFEDRVVIHQDSKMTRPSLLSEVMQGSEENFDPSKELNVSFEYQCNANWNTYTKAPCEFEICPGIQIQDSIIMRSSSSFSCLSGAALSANATLANTNICNGIIGEEILPGLDSPKSFKRLLSSPSLSKLDLPASSSQSSISTLGGSAPSDNELLENGKSIPLSAPMRIESYSFLSAMDVQMAGGAAGEDRVQAVCSEENGWLFCGIYDGFNGRDAADFLAGTFYETIGLSLQMLEWHMKQQDEPAGVPSHKAPSELLATDDVIKKDLDGDLSNLDIECKLSMFSIDADGDLSSESYRHGVLKCLTHALAQAESDFMCMVEQEMENRPDLVSVGSSVLVMLLHGMDLYILNLGDSRAVLATSKDGSLQAIQLTEIHTVDNEVEYRKVLADHPDDPSPVFGGRVKGRLKLTRAFGVGYLKKSKLNDALIGILRVRNLCSPPYVYTHPFTTSHRVTGNDLFVVLGSDGLFDFFNNNEVVELVHQFVQDSPFGDPAKFLIEQLVLRVAEHSGFSIEELMRIPVGRRRKYHDDVTVIVIILGNKQRMSSASTSL